MTLHGIMQMERSMTGKINPNGPYESARLSRASASIADGAIRFGYPEKARDGSFSGRARASKKSSSRLPRAWMMPCSTSSASSA
jgi:hypothetical protein